MINYIDLQRIVQFLPIGTINKPNYAFSGGTAVYCILRRGNADRIHRDIDMYVFDRSSIMHMFPSFTDPKAVACARLTKNGIKEGEKIDGVPIDIIIGSYYDSEIIPCKSDVQHISLNQTSMPILSPEFIVASKFSFPNIHRTFDIIDIFRIIKGGHIRKPDYFCKLIETSSIGSIINIQDIFKIKQKFDIEKIILQIHKYIIRRFLSSSIHIEILNPLQIFVLLDISEEMLSRASKQLEIYGKWLNHIELYGKINHLVKLGLCFLLINLPEDKHWILSDSSIRNILMKAIPRVFHFPSSLWLSPCKIVATVFKEFRYLRHESDMIKEMLWTPKIVADILNRVLFYDVFHARHTLLNSIKYIFHDNKLSGIEQINYIKKLL